MKEKRFLVLDCESATMSFANEIAQDAEQKKKIAIAKPLIYDIGWTTCDRNGNIEDKKHFLVAETFCVPSVFNTAYYAEKRPIYIQLLNEGRITIMPWNDIMKIYIEDLKKVDAVGAFNSMFDFKKAIPFTELYINELYSPDYQAWENEQRKLCQRIISERYQKNPEKEFEAEEPSSDK